MPGRLRRLEWKGVAQDLADAWTLREGTRVARCRIRNHPLGWELVLDVDNELLRSQAFRKPDPLLDAATAWKKEMVEAGWHTCVCVNGWRCEQHGEQGWPHDDCAGPGVPCSNPVCEAGVTLQHQLEARR